LHYTTLHDRLSDIQCGVISKRCWQIEGKKTAGYTGREWEHHAGAARE
jgi:hypothetical protein